MNKTEKIMQTILIGIPTVTATILIIQVIRDNNIDCIPLVLICICFILALSFGIHAIVELWTHTPEINWYVPTYSEVMRLPESVFLLNIYKHLCEHVSPEVDQHLMAIIIDVAHSHQFNSDKVLEVLDEEYSTLYDK